MFEYGYERSIKELAVAPLEVFIYFTVLDYLINAFSNVIPQYTIYFEMIKFIYIFGTLIGNILLIKKMEYWSTEYLFGWLIGLVLLFLFIFPIYLDVGVIGILDILFAVSYIGIGIYILLKRTIL